MTSYGSSDYLKSRINLKTRHFPFIVHVADGNKDIWIDEFGFWLLDNIGKNHETWEWWWECVQVGPRSNGFYIFEFKNEEDKVKFILRWL